MNKSRLFKGLLLLLCVIGTTAYGQTETKKLKEVFNVTPETVLSINTTNADIQFETWSKNEIEIEAIVEIEGATSEEANDYFKNDPIKIVGNSKNIDVTTSTMNSFFITQGADFFDNSLFDTHFNTELDELMGGMDHFIGDSLHFFINGIRDMPPMPPIPSTNFDYKAFERDGEKYLKKWQSEFKEGFGKEYQESMKAWQEEIAKSQKRNEKRSEALEKRSEERSKRMKERSERMAERAKERAERMKAFHKRRIAAMERRNNRFPSRVAQTDSLSSYLFSNDSLHHQGPNSFYFSSGGKSRNYKVKKTIKIRMPKGNKIKMNVRHGEVKLAANTLNMDAHLSYSNLLAFEIGGEETRLKASYSPVSVEKWNLGQLQTEYSDAVNLQEVVDLRLTSTSSEVTIDRLLKKAVIKSDYGPLKILSIAKDFSDLDVSLQNAELDCELPNTPLAIYINGTSSKLSLPASLHLERTKNGNTTIHKGYHLQKNGGKGIIINAKYSDIVLD